MGRRRGSKCRKLNGEIEVPTPTAASPPSGPPPPPWIELPEGVTANILQRLGAEEMLESARKVCTTWRKVCKDPSVWRVVDLRNRSDDSYSYKHELMCRCAVDLSQGQLVDLTITHFGDDDMIKYVADRSSNLRRLTISKPFDISGWKLAESVKKLPQLEELHLIYMSSVQEDDIETIGISNPLLKSFTFSDCWSDCRGYIDSSGSDDDCDNSTYNRYALAISKTMHNLHHLRLFSNLMDNEGLEAILDGCPHLESLDLRICLRLNLKGPLGKRCREQIKDLRLPADSIADLDWHIRPLYLGSNYYNNDEYYESIMIDYYSL